MDKTYWNGKGRHQKLYAILVTKIPSDNSVVNPKQNPALEKLRIAANCYYDLYNNGLCNRAKEFYKVFGFSGTKLLRSSSVYSLGLETKLGEFILSAAKEQGIKLRKPKPNINDAQHPSRQKAIKILEAIAEKLGNENIFDNASQNGGEPDGTWYEYEDMVTNIIEGGKK